MIFIKNPVGIPKSQECLFEYTKGIVIRNVENYFESVKNCVFIGFIFQQTGKVFNINVETQWKYKQ